MFKKLRFRYHLFMTGIYVNKADKKRIKLDKMDFVAISRAVDHQDKAIKLYNEIYNQDFISIYTKLNK